MQIILLLITLSSIAFLTIYGAGMYSWSLLLTTTVLAGATCVAYFLKTGSRRSEVGGRKSEVGSRRSECENCSVGSVSQPDRIASQSEAGGASELQRAQTKRSYSPPEEVGRSSPSEPCDEQSSSCNKQSEPSTKHLSFLRSKLLALLSLPLIHIAIVAFILITLIPLPKPLTIVTGGERYKQNVVTTELLEKAESLEICKPSLRLFSITRNRAGTMRVLLLIVAMYSVFEAVRLLSLRNRIIYLHILISIGVAVAVVGYLSYAVYPQGNKLWWIFSVPPFSRPLVGSFLNMNHYAGFIAMLSIAAIGITVLNIRTKHWILVFLTIVAAFIMAFFVLLSASRGAILALSAGLFSLAIAFIIHLKGRIRIISILTIIIAIAIGSIFALQNDKIRGRISTLRHPHSDSGVQPRLVAWGGALRLWTHYPVIGVGGNAFRVTYPQHKDSQFRAYRRFAENEFLHILAEGGLVGIALSGLLLLSIVIALRHGMQSNPAANSLAIGAVAVLITGAVHVSVDFILHLPLYAITIASIIAVGTRTTPSNKTRRNAIIITLAICLGLIPLTTPMTKYDTGGYIVPASNDQLATLMTWSPPNAQVLRRLGANIAQNNTPETDALAEEFLEQAAEYDPNNFKIWIKLGKLRLKSNNKSGAKEAFKKATAIRSWAPVPKID